MLEFSMEIILIRVNFTENKTGDMVGYYFILFAYYNISLEVTKFMLKKSTEIESISLVHKHSTCPLLITFVISFMQHITRRFREKEPSKVTTKIKPNVSIVHQTFNAKHRNKF